MFEPTDRKFGRASWKWLDHVCRGIWRGYGKAFEQSMTDLMIYGSAPIVLQESPETIVMAESVDPYDGRLPRAF